MAEVGCAQSSKAEAGMVRSIGAVAAGCLAMMVLALSASQLVRQSVPQHIISGGDPEAPETLVLLFLLAAAGAAVMAGSFLAGRVAPRRPMLHALVVGGIAYMVSLAVTAILWTEAPRWFHMAAVLLQVPAAWLGGLLLARRHRATAFPFPAEQLSRREDASKTIPWRNLNR
jgi:hypothetical protein